MLSLEMAKKLKEAGLEWIPKYGDMCYLTYNKGLKSEHTKLIAVVENGLTCSEIFAPRLEQLLAEIERRGYAYELKIEGTQSEARYCLLLYEWDEQVAEIDFGLGWTPCEEFYNAKSSEEAAAQALLWILGQE